MVYVDSARSRYVEKIVIGGHELLADEPSEAGGTDAGPGPYELLLAALGTCTCITVRMYAERKQWPLEAVHVALRHARILSGGSSDGAAKLGMIDQIQVEVGFTGALSADQRQKLLDIASKCPVHRTLTSEVEIHTRVAQALDAPA